MRIKKIIATGITIAAIAPIAARAAEPSAGCAGGTATPVGGITVKNSAPADAWVCNGGSTVPAPAKGAARIHTDSAAQSAYLDVDGDSNNSTRACTDGFFRVAVDAKGPHLYQSANGSYADTDPTKKGNQTAKEEDPQTFAGNLQKNCA